MTDGAKERRGGSPENLASFCRLGRYFHCPFARAGYKSRSVVVEANQPGNAAVAESVDAQR